IAGYLAPPDILALSRSNKFFRNLLMQRSAKHIWKTALGNVPGLPRCPADLCEPQYVALLYSKYCSICGASVVRPMEPYLHVRLCNPCRKEQLMNSDEIEDETLRSFIPQTPKLPGQVGFCLRSDKERIEAIYNDLAKVDGELTDDDLPWANQQLMRCIMRLRHGGKLETFLQEEAESRAEELETSKSRRREEIKRRLGDAGWDELDWSFPEFVARKWAHLVEGPKPMTDRVWQNLYPKLVPWLTKNREHHTKRLKSERWGHRQRQLRRLLLEIKHRNVFLKVERKVVTGEKAVPSDGVANAAVAGDDDEGEMNEVDEDEDGDGSTSQDSDEKYCSRGQYGPGHLLVNNKVILRRPFPSMVDALALPIISDLLDEDVDVNTLGERFEESRREIEDTLDTWSSTVENDLAALLTSGTARDGEEAEAETPGLDLQSALPPKYHGFFELPPACHQLLRADSVFRIVNDDPCPPPLYYPELFQIFQSRNRHYFEPSLDLLNNGPARLGYIWDTDEVACYAEGVVVAKALLDQLGRPNAAQFELQLLGPRFSCGLCSDKWVRTWNEMVHHYAETLVHARLAEEYTGSAKGSISYNNVHSLDPDSRTRGKNKPLVILRTVEEAEELRSKYQEDQTVVRCLLCKKLGISFLSHRDTVVKHVRSVHGIKTPKAEHYWRTHEEQLHARIRDG
ncbi:hypothetical protein FS749_013214, partial [Ceratobasidium sp. UAMH 11750]